MRDRFDILALFTNVQNADSLKVSRGTVIHDWTFARAWLRNEMAGVL